MRIGHSPVLLKFFIGFTLVAALIGLPGAVAQGEDVRFALGPGEEYSHTFDGVGEGKYHCHAHASKGMGDIEVLASDGSEPETHIIRITDNGANGAFDPLHLTIRSGDTITWVNENQLTHDMMIWEPGTEVHHDHGEGDHGHGDHDHDHHHDDAQEGSAVAPILAILALCVLVATARRR